MNCKSNCRIKNYFPSLFISFFTFSKCWPNKFENFDDYFRIFRMICRYCWKESWSHESHCYILNGWRHQCIVLYCIVSYSRLVYHIIWYHMISYHWLSYYQQLFVLIQFLKHFHDFINYFYFNYNSVFTRF